MTPDRPPAKFIIVAPYVFDHLDSIRGVLNRAPCGLITDVDGTISHTALTPQEAEVTPLNHHYLSLICHRLALVAAVSGRAAVEVKNMIKIEEIVYVGNHGLERWSGGRSRFSGSVRRYSRMIEAAVKELAPLLWLEGIRIENKGVTATIHYRLCPEPELAKRKVLAAIDHSRRAKRLRIKQGRMAIELVPPVDINKGTATRDLIKEYKLQGGLYLGDDLTDIDAFRAIHAATLELNFQGLAIGITSQETPETLAAEADFTLNGVNDVEHFLKWMSETIPGPG